MHGLEILILLVLIYWLTPLILIIIGLAMLKSKPKSAKVLFIIAGTMLVVGLGFCGLLMS